jgi:toxin secretion/phage lysis holin
MNNVLTYLKLAVSGVVAFILSLLGGYDELLGGLFLLVLLDIISGLLKGISTKSLSSTKLREGAIHKAGIIILVIICANADIFWKAVMGSPINIGGTDMYIRNWGILYFCFEEFISIIENLILTGVPFPKWLRNLLSQANDTLNNSTPTALVEWIKKTFNIDISSTKKNTDEEKKE